MSSFTSFGIIGSGHVGSFILAALLAQNPAPANLIVLSRNPNSKKFPPGVKVIKVTDYDDVDAVAGILSENSIDVVISTVGYAAISSQKTMADAAKKAGTKLFVPSEFGSPTDDSPDEFPSFQEKDQVARYIESIGLPYTRIYTGGFIGSAIVTISGVDVNGKINVVGKGQSPGSWTAVEDVGGFVGYVLTHLPPSSLYNKVLRLEGDRASFLDIAKWYNKEVAHVAVIPGSNSEVRTMLANVFESGAGSTGWIFKSGREGEGEDAAGSANRFWEGHRWKKIRDVITKL